MMKQSEFRKVKLSEIVLHKSNYPRLKVSLKVAVQYADAMQTGVVFPPIVVARYNNEFVLVDGAHRKEAYKLLNGSAPDEVNVEYLGEMRELDVFEEAIRRNRANGRQFSDGDIKKIVSQYKGMEGRDINYVSGLLQIPVPKLERMKPGRVSYAAKEHVLPDGALREPRGRKDPQSFSMTFEEMVDWTIKFVRKMNPSGDEERIDLLTQLRDEINSFLEKRRKEEKAAGKSVETEGKADHEPMTRQEEKEPSRDNGKEARKVVDVQTLAMAIKNSFDGMGEEEARSTAFQVLSYFGYERSCLANNLEEGDNQVFYMLEDKGLLRTVITETVTVDGKQPWRISEFELVYEKIFAAAERSESDEKRDVYASLPQEVWAR